ncbi:MAG: triose-phosphate isomerase [Candidatus Helarchaeota archaeon]
MKSVETPVLILNYKTYELATGQKAVELSKIVDNLASEYGIEIIIAPQFTDIYRITQEVNIKVFAQHVDPNPPGKSTGHVTIEAIREAGAVGTLLNHAERKLPYEIIDETYKRLSKFGLVACVCAETVDKAKDLAVIGPEYIAFEIPELIGTGKSISTYSPDDVMVSVKLIQSTNPSVIPLTGAGISTGEDVYASLKLGAKGALVASAVANSPTPKEVLEDMCKAVVKFKNES